MERTLQVLNALERDGVAIRYAIGGAMAAMFYAEPVLTFDLDILVLLPRTTGPLLTRTPLYDDLRRRGYAEEGGCVTIEGVPVQFLPTYRALIEEALSQACDTRYEQTPTRVLRAEHLITIAVQTDQEKDRHRVRLLMEHTSLDRTYLAEMLARHALEATWRRGTHFASPWTPRPGVAGGRRAVPHLAMTEVAAGRRSHFPAFHSDPLKPRSVAVDVGDSPCRPSGCWCRWDQGQAGSGAAA